MVADDESVGVAVTANEGNQTLEASLGLNVAARQETAELVQGLESRFDDLVEAVSGSPAVSGSVSGPEVRGDEARVERLDVQAIGEATVSSVRSCESLVEQARDRYAGVVAASSDSVRAALDETALIRGAQIEGDGVQATAATVTDTPHDELRAEVTPSVSTTADIRPSAQLQLAQRQRLDANDLISALLTGETRAAENRVRATARLLERRPQWDVAADPALLTRQSAERALFRATLDAEQELIRSAPSDVLELSQEQHRAQRELSDRHVAEQGLLSRVGSAVPVVGGAEGVTSGARVQPKADEAAKLALSEHQQEARQHVEQDVHAREALLAQQSGEHADLLGRLPLAPAIDELSALRERHSVERSELLHAQAAAEVTARYGEHAETLRLAHAGELARLGTSLSDTSTVAAADPGLTSALEAADQLILATAAEVNEREIRRCGEQAGSELGLRAGQLAERTDLAERHRAREVDALASIRATGGSHPVSEEEAVGRLEVLGGAERRELQERHARDRAELSTQLAEQRDLDATHRHEVLTQLIDQRRILHEAARRGAHPADMDQLAVEQQTQRQALAREHETEQQRLAANHTATRQTGEDHAARQLILSELYAAEAVDRVTQEHEQSETLPGPAQQAIETLTAQRAEDMTQLLREQAADMLEHRQQQAWSSLAERLPTQLREAAERLAEAGVPMASEQRQRGEERANRLLMLAQERQRDLMAAQQAADDHRSGAFAPDPHARNEAALAQHLDLRVEGLRQEIRYLDSLRASPALLLATSDDQFDMLREQVTSRHYQPTADTAWTDAAARSIAASCEDIAHRVRQNVRDLRRLAEAAGPDPQLTSYIEAAARPDPVTLITQAADEMVRAAYPEFAGLDELLAERAKTVAMLADPTALDSARRSELQSAITENDNFLASMRGQLDDRVHREILDRLDHVTHAVQSGTQGRTGGSLNLCLDRLRDAAAIRVPPAAPSISQDAVTRMQRTATQTEAQKVYQGLSDIADDGSLADYGSLVERTQQFNLSVRDLYGLTVRDREYIGLRLDAHHVMEKTWFKQFPDDFRAVFGWRETDDMAAVALHTEWHIRSGEAMATRRGLLGAETEVSLTTALRRHLDAAQPFATLRQLVEAHADFYMGYSLDLWVRLLPWFDSAFKLLQKQELEQEQEVQE